MSPPHATRLRPTSTAAHASRRQKATPLTTFRELGVLPEIADALERGGITTPFPIQEMTLSIALLGTDLIGQARTGTGKTLAFGIPVLQRTVAPHDPDYDELAAPGKPQALVVAPTRELALQVAGDLELRRRRPRHPRAHGVRRRRYEPQLDALDAGVDVVVGTPGRLIDLMNRRALDLSPREGAGARRGRRDARPRLPARRGAAAPAKTPETRQTMLFSATMPAAIVSLARTHMRHPMNIRAESSLRHRDGAGDGAVHLPGPRPGQARDHRPDPAGRGRRHDDRLHPHQAAGAAGGRRPGRARLPGRPLHGDMAQVAREQALTRFREGKVRVLVATDVAARGIDVQGVTHVINYSCPEDEKTYVHRIGRTGRAGATGIAITFVDWADADPVEGHQQGARTCRSRSPQETYSTSEHLFHDLGIPPGTKGRIVPRGPGPSVGRDSRRRPCERRRGGAAATPPRPDPEPGWPVAPAAGRREYDGRDGRETPRRRAAGTADLGVDAPAAAVAGGRNRGGHGRR